MSQPAKAPEPSMEEILASIRRIIADDDATKEAPKAAPRPPEPSSVKAAPDPNEDVLELTEAMEAPPPEPPQPAFRRIEPTQDVVFDEPPPRPARSPEPEAALLSSAASAAIHSAFGNLAHSMLVQNSRTLEDLVKEMLRPMLKAWLDDN